MFYRFKESVFGCKGTSFSQNGSSFINALTAMLYVQILLIQLHEFKHKQIIYVICDIKFLFHNYQIFSFDFPIDSGLVIPTITHELRKSLFAVANKYGFTIERQSEMVGRSASEMVLQLLGGSHRYNTGIQNYAL